MRLDRNTIHNIQFVNAKNIKSDCFCLHFCFMNMDIVYHVGVLLCVLDDL